MALEAARLVDSLSKLPSSICGKGAVGILLTFVAISLVARGSAEEADVLDLAVPPFASSSGFGEGLAAIYELGIRRRHDFGGDEAISGLRISNSTSIVETDFDDVDRWPYDAVLWGHINEFRSHYVVQSALTITEQGRSRYADQYYWKVEVDYEGENFEFIVPLFSDFFVLPIVDLREAMGQEVSLWRGLPIFESAELSRQIGQLASAFVYLAYSADAALVRSENATGWVRLILSSQTEASISFVSGVVSFLRGHFSHAKKHFSSALDSEMLDTTLAIDSYTFLGLSEIAVGGDGLTHLSSALRLNPLRRSVRQYLIMSDLQEMREVVNRDGWERAAVYIERISTNLDLIRPLFALNDPWVNELDRLLSVVERQDRHLMSIAVTEVRAEIAAQYIRENDLPAFAAFSEGVSRDQGVYAFEVIGNLSTVAPAGNISWIGNRRPLIPGHLEGSFLERVAIAEGPGWVEYPALVAQTGEIEDKHIYIVPVGDYVVGVDWRLE